MQNKQFLVLGGTWGAAWQEQAEAERGSPLSHKRAPLVRQGNIPACAAADWLIGPARAGGGGAHGAAVDAPRGPRHAGGVLRRHWLCRAARGGGVVAAVGAGGGGRAGASGQRHERKPGDVVVRVSATDPLEVTKLKTQSPSSISVLVAEYTVRSATVKYPRYYAR
eukprot:140269-Prorocentrum_minimum.AAC.2